MRRIEIFRAGTHTAMGGAEMTFSEGQVRATALAYDPALKKAPIVIGHPALDAPAFGWVEALDASGGTLSAYVSDVEPAFAEAVRQGRYRNVSASFYPPSAKGNPRPGVFYLRHVGFLGAVPPAVAGLRPAEFAGDEGEAVEFASAAPAAVVSAELERALARVRELEERDRERERGELVQFADSLVLQARIPAGLRDNLVAVLAALPGDQAVSFSEGAETVEAGAREALRRLFGRLPPMVSFGEFAAPAPPPDEPQMTLPHGLAVDAEGLRLAGEADALAKRAGISFADAVKRLSRGKQ